MECLARRRLKTRLACRRTRPFLRLRAPRAVSIRRKLGKCLQERAAGWEKSFARRVPSPVFYSSKSIRSRGCRSTQANVCRARFQGAANLFLGGRRSLATFRIARTTACRGPALFPPASLSPGLCLSSCAPRLENHPATGTSAKTQAR